MRPIPHPPVVAVVLAAGASRRMGRPKGLLEVAGVPLLRAHVEALAGAGLEVSVVLGAHADSYLPVLPAGVEVVVNELWSSTEMKHSVALGLRGKGVVLLTPVDVPPARLETIAALLQGTGDAVPTWNGVRGHPVRLDPPHADVRLDQRLQSAREVPVADPDCVVNLNTPEDWRAWTPGR